MSLYLQIASNQWRRDLLTLRRPRSEFTILRFSSKRTIPSGARVHTNYLRDRHSKSNAQAFALVFGLAMGLGIASGVIMSRCEEDTDLPHPAEGNNLRFPHFLTAEGPQHVNDILM